VGKAYELRDRASDRERRRIVATYHLIVTGNLHSALDAMLAAKRDYSRDGLLAINAADIYMSLGQWENALQLMLDSPERETTNVTYSNFAITQMALGRHEDARRTLESAFARNIDAYYLRLDAYQEAFLRGDDEAMRRHFDVVVGRPGEEDFLLAAQADTEAYLGRMERSREFAARAAASALRAGGEEISALWIAQAALREVEMGFREHAIAAAQAALERSPGRHVRCIGAYALARSGDRTTAERIAGELDQEHPEETAVQHCWLPCIRAALALDSGDFATALRALEPAESIELGRTVPFEGGFMIPAYLRGLAYRAAARHEEAAREFAKIESRPGLVKNFVIYPLAARARKGAG
jgi:eukaryotic-like serine/threonine-protein kinase